jgi:hypothetical protein
MTPRKAGAVGPRSACGPRSAGVLAVAACLAACLLACIEGSETGNPAKGLTGRIRTLDGQPAARTRVVLVPEGFVPADPKAISALPADTTDAQGEYRFQGAAEGRYNLEAMNPADGSRSRLEGVEAAAGLSVAPTQTLAMPGSVSASLTGAGDTVNGFIYVPGSTFRAAVRASASVVRLDSLPAGFLDSLVYASTTDALAPRAFAWNLRVLPAGASQAEGPYLAWRRSALLAVDGGPGGAKLAKAVAGFPVRLALPDSVLASARADGSDLRVANEKGQALPCEIEQVSGSPGALWVRMDTVFADRPTPLRLYWDYGGRDSLPAAEKPGKVFTPADGYAGAWHLNEDPAAANGKMIDASGQGNDGIPVGYSAPGANSAGVAGGSLKFDGKAQFMGTRIAFDDPETFTALIWFRADKSQGGRIFEFADKDTSRTVYFDRLLHIYKDGSVHFGIYPPDSAGKAPPTASTYRILGTAKGYDDGLWHQAAGRLSDSGMAFFVDGARVANDPATHTAQVIKGYWRLGYDRISGWGPSGTGEYFQGSLDEFWAVHAALSDDFVKLSFENLKPGSGLVRWP